MTIIQSKTNNLWENIKTITNQQKSFIQQIFNECLFCAKHVTTEQSAGTHGGDCNTESPISSFAYQKRRLQSRAPLPLYSRQTWVGGSTKKTRENYITSRLEVEGLRKKEERGNTAQTHSNIWKKAKQAFKWNLMGSKNREVRVFTTLSSVSELITQLF